MSPSLAAEEPFDIGLRRDRGQLDLALTRDAPVEVRLSYFHEKRHGTRGSGTSFGFNNVVETPEAIDYRTQDLRLSAEWPQSWGLLRGAVNFNQFVNSIPVAAVRQPLPRDRLHRPERLPVARIELDRRAEVRWPGPAAGQQGRHRHRSASPSSSAGTRA